MHAPPGLWRAVAASPVPSRTRSVTLRCKHDGQRNATLSLMGQDATLVRSARKQLLQLWVLCDQCCASVRGRFVVLAPDRVVCTLLAHGHANE